MKQYNFEWFERAKAVRPLEESVSIGDRGIRIGKALVQGLELSKVKYVNIGIDRSARVACIKPSDKGFLLRYADKAFREVSGTAMVKELSEVVGSHPQVTVIDGVAILTPIGQTVEPKQDPVKQPKPAKVDKTVLVQPKRQGRPPKQKTPEEPQKGAPTKVDEPKEDKPVTIVIHPPQGPKDMCSNCDYHKPIRGVDDRVMCEKYHQQKNSDGYCLNYEIELN